MYYLIYRIHLIYILLFGSMTGVSGWIDTALPPQAAIQSATNRRVSQGGSTILECRPYINAPNSTVNVTWLRNSVLIPDQDPFDRKLDAWSLMVRNFSLPMGSEEKMVRYECIVGVVMGAELQNHSVTVTRSFNLTLAEGTFWFIL